MVTTGLDIARRRQAQAEANRASFTFASRMLDELRAAGIQTARITFAEQDGRTVGTRGAAGVPATWWQGISNRKSK